MEGCLFGIANNEVQSSVNLVKNEGQYLCCFNNYVENFDQKKKILAAKHRDVKREFQKGKGVFSFKSEAQEWVNEADDIIRIDSKIKKRFLVGRCPNCWWQYRKGKELAKETQHIEDLLGRCNSNIIAGRANIPDIKHLPLQNFLHFKSRESKFQDLLKALQDNNCNMIGLQGIGGAGKTSMAREVAHKLKESNLIDKFIFLVVSKPPDFKKTRGELAKGLDLNLEKEKEEELPNTICSRITKMEEKLLIILDDVWENFDLMENLGIPSDHKGCTLLITTRSSNVCKKMECRMIELQMLDNKEALKLFEAHAKLNNSCRGLKGMPEKIVKHCGGIPVVIVAIARALKNEPALSWKDALKTLEDCVVDQHLEGAYKCLKLSYDNLKNQKSKELFLISSLFPEDYQVPIQVLTKIGIGLGSFGENDRYHLARSEVHEAIWELIDFSLLLHGRDECVEMHDSIREVALWIGDRDIQSLIDSKMAMKESLRYLLWKNDDFPTNFDGSKLEVLLIFLDGSKEFKVSGALFKEMMRLKVLVLFNNYYGRTPALSLMNSLQLLKDIRTLILKNLDLGDISILGNLLSLGTIWFYDCSINELPRKFLKLNKLRSLEVERCPIKKNNPFEVIERCSQLEELTFVANRCDNEDAISQNGSPLTLHRYRISSKDLSGYFEKYGSMSRCLQMDDQLSHLVSEATFKQLVRRAELLILEGKDAPRIWKNSILDDIVATDDRGMMNDLIVLHLSSCPYMEFPIDTKDHDSGVAGFCNLFGLHLSNVEVEDLCHGPLPSGVWEQLGIMKLNKCHKLKSILSNGNYNLCHLKSMKLEDCPMLASVFQPSTARSLMKLEKLTITNCSALECIMVSEDSDSNLKSYHDSLFPKLKKLRIGWCSKLRRILPILFAGGLASLEMLSIYECEQLEYMFDKFEEGEDAMLPSLEELVLSGVPSFIGMCKEHHQLVSSSMQKPSSPHSRHNCSSNMNQSPARRAFSWVQACCSLNKSRPASEDTKITVPEQRPHDHTVPQELDPSTCGVFLFHAAQSLLMPSLKNVRKIKLWGCGNMLSLSTLSIAASTISLESLEIEGCHKLKCITTHEGDAQVDNKNYCSIFPTLENLKIENCWDLEFVFQSSISGGLQKLKSLYIRGVPELKYVVGNYEQDQQNEELHFDLPALATLSIKGALKIKSICAKNYKMVLSSLQNVEMWDCGIKSFDDYDMVNLTNTEELNSSTGRVPLFHASQILLAQSLKNVREVTLSQCWNIISLSTLSLASTILWEGLSIIRCDQLKCIVEDEAEAGTHMNYNYSIFPKLKRLQVIGCNALEYLFPAHAFRCPACLVRSLPMSQKLSISKCEELVNTVEEDYEKNDDDHHLCREPCFPNLEYVSVTYCDKLRHLFSIPISGILPKLRSLRICTANGLEHVLVRQGEMKEMAMKDVLPQLSQLVLMDLPNLASLCYGIDFQTLKGDDNTNVDGCPKFSFYEISTTELQACPETTCSQVEEKAEKNLSSHLNTEQSLNMGETTQQSLTEKVPLHASPNLTVLPIRDNTHASAKIFEEEDEEEEEDSLITSRHPRNGKKVSSSLPEKKLENSTDETTVSSEQTSTSLNQTPSSIIPKHSDDYVVCDKSHPHSSSSFECVDGGENKEAGMVQNESISNVEISNPAQREQESSHSKDSQPARAMPATLFVNISKEESSKIVEVRAEDGASILETPHPSSLTSKKEPIPVSPNPTILPRSPGTTAKFFEEEEKGGPFVPPAPIVSSEQQAYETTSPIASKALMSPKQTLMCTPSETSYGRKIQENVGAIDQRLHETLGAIQISSQPVECGSSHMAPSVYETNNNLLSVHGVKEIADMMKLEGAEPFILAEAFQTHPQLHLSSEDRSTELLCYSYRVLLNILNILATRSPSTITEADKILLAKHLKDASVLGFDKDWLESVRNRVSNCDASELHRMQQALKGLGNKLRANKIELANIRDQEAKAAKLVEMTQKELEATHKELEAAYKGLEAAQSHFNVAQQEHANIRARYSQLLEEWQGISEQQYQCSEIIAAKFRPFGF